MDSAICFQEGRKIADVVDRWLTKKLAINSPIWTESRDRPTVQRNSANPPKYNFFPPKPGSWLGPE